MPKDHAMPPPEILALIQQPPLLKGESVQQYNALFEVLVCQVAPVDLIEWLWVLNYLDCAWEILRVRRFKSILIDLQQKQALQAVILKTLPSDRGHTPSSLAQAEALWSADPTQFANRSIDPLSVPAMAVVQIKQNLEALNKMLERAERRCDTIMQQLEYRREVFAHRARRAADNILNAKTEHVQSLSSAKTAPALAATSPMTPNQIPADEVAVVPTLAEASAPSSEETSADNFKSTSASDA